LSYGGMKLWRQVDICIFISFNKNHQASELTVLAPDNNRCIRISVSYSKTLVEDLERFSQAYGPEQANQPAKLDVFEIYAFVGRASTQMNHCRLGGQDS
jgi:hypothetical protein